MCNVKDYDYSKPEVKIFSTFETNLVSYIYIYIWVELALSFLIHMYYVHMLFTFLQPTLKPKPFLLDITAYALLSPAHITAM